MLSIPIPLRDQINSTGRYLPLGSGDQSGVAFGDFVSRLFYVAIVLSALLVMGYFIISGYEWLSAGGKAEKVEEAQSRMRNALIGLAIIASVMAIGSLVNQFFQTGLQVDLEGQTSGSTTAPPGVWPNCTPDQPCITP